MRVFVYSCMVCDVYRYKYSMLWMCGMCDWYIGMWCDKQCMVYVWRFIWIVCAHVRVVCACVCIQLYGL